MARTRGGKSAHAARALPAMRSHRPAAGLWWQGLACGAVVALATPTALLAVLLLAPAVVALVFDASEGRSTVRPVLLWGLAASVRPMTALWTSGHNVGNALAMAGDLSTLATAWAAQGGAWLVAELLPLLIGGALHAVSAARAKALRELRAGYEAEWDIAPVPGEEPAEDARSALGGITREVSRRRGGEHLNPTS